jgi:hypothetical protein
MIRQNLIKHNNMMNLINLINLINLMNLMNPLMPFFLNSQKIKNNTTNETDALPHPGSYFRNLS